jgi:GDP-L-fucose synthase
MLGSAFLRRLALDGRKVITATRSELDLLRQDKVEAWFEQNRPQVVIVAAAKVGGIHANTQYPADFLYQNLVIETNVIEAARRSNVEKLLFVASSCVYPRMAPQPMVEDALLTGVPEPTNEGYALAKIAGIKLCEMYRRQYGCDFIAAIPPNLYGPFDNFDPLTSHVIAALMRRAHEAKLAGADALEIWGTGVARRELLHVDDAVDGCLFLLQNYSGEAAVNVGSGEDVSIRDLAALISRTVGLKGEITFDRSKPDGMPAKLMNVSRLENMGWKAKKSLSDGLADTYQWFLNHVAQTSN